MPATCWICGGGPLTGEHLVKKSDLRAIFGPVTQSAPLYLNDRRTKNRRIGSLDSKLLKSAGRICAYCNGTRTQPYDRAWETFSRAYRASMPRLRPGAVFRAGVAFPYNTAREMLNVHLYFAKLFGCHIKAYNVPIPIGGFARAIMEGRAHPKLYLKFGIGPEIAGEGYIGTSEMNVATKGSDGSVAFATWFHSVAGLTVNVSYAVDGERRQALIGAWHPRQRSNRLTIADFRGVQPTGPDSTSKAA
jgi:hypothetical protein